MRAITVTHALGAYPVYVSPGILASLADLVRRHLPGRQVALITDTTVGRLYEEWESGASAAWRSAGPAAEVAAYDWITRLSIHPGEAEKTRARWSELSDILLERSVGRDGALVALGGGVVGDLTGFVAATYMRGIPYVQVPTTLLAMVDASVGGKTGVDTPHGKNLIGAFHAPAAVVVDPLTLRSLPERVFRAGLAEVVKHGLVADADYFAWLEREADAILARDGDTLARLVARSVEIKANVVSGDERESGQRAILNAGHTVAHALEHVTQYGIPHGEAVAIGLVAECEFAEQLGIATAGLRDRVAALLTRFGLPVRLPHPVPGERIRAAMTLDKKNRAAEPLPARTAADSAASTRSGSGDAGAERGPQIYAALASGVGTPHNPNGRWTTAVDARTILRGLSVVAQTEKGSNTKN